MIEVNPSRQALARPLSDLEERLADRLQSAFAQGMHDFSKVVEHLNSANVARPSGSSEPWTVDALSLEISDINASLDEAYGEFGIYRLRAGLPGERKMDEKYQAYLARTAKN